MFKKLKGYQKASRDRFLLIAEGILTHEEFVIYELGVALTDWDKTHVETYGTFLASNLQLAQLLHWKSDSTVSRHRQKLIQKGFFIVGNDGRTLIKDYEKWQLKRLPENTSEKMQASSAKMQPTNAVLHETPAKMHESSPQNPDQPLVSFKGNSSFKTKEEYQRIWKEDYKSSPDFTPDDMKWIDQNVREDPLVPS